MDTINFKMTDFSLKTSKANNETGYHDTKDICEDITSNLAMLSRVAKHQYEIRIDNHKNDSIVDSKNFSSASLQVDNENDVHKLIVTYSVPRIMDNVIYEISDNVVTYQLETDVDMQIIFSTLANEDYFYLSTQDSLDHISKAEIDCSL